MFLEIHQLWRTLPKFFSRSSSTCEASVKANSVLGAWIIQSICLFIYNFEHSFLSALSLLTQTLQLTGVRLNRGHYESKMTLRPQPSGQRTEKKVFQGLIFQKPSRSVYKTNPLGVNTHIPLAHTQPWRLVHCECLVSRTAAANMRSAYRKQADENKSKNTSMGHATTFLFVWGSLSPTRLHVFHIKYEAFTHPRCFLVLHFK